VQDHGHLLMVGWNSLYILQTIGESPCLRLSGLPAQLCWRASFAQRIRVLKDLLTLSILTFVAHDMRSCKLTLIQH